MHVVAGNNQRAFSKRALNTVEAAFEQSDSNARTQTYSFVRYIAIAIAILFYSPIPILLLTHLNKHKE
jgi:hypothetical protein